jgi:hypothetical protein
MIRGYPRRPSVRPGETLTLHVSTDAPAFRVEAYRQGATLVPLGRLGPERLPGVHVPDGPPDQDWGWPAYDLAIPADWRSGAYVAMLVEIDAGGRERRPDTRTPDGTDAGLKDGQVFGDDPAFPLVGYEAAGAAFVRKHGVAVATPFTQAEGEGSPCSICVTSWS